MPHLADCRPEAASLSRSSSNWSMAANFLQPSPQASSVKFNSVSSSPPVTRMCWCWCGEKFRCRPSVLVSSSSDQWSVLSGSGKRVSVSTSSRVWVGGDELSSFTLENSYNTNRK